MTPTRGDEEIEGRSYKDYAYSPVPVSSSSPVFDTTPAKESAESNVQRVVINRYPADMTEKGSKLVQFLAAAAGKFILQ